MDRKNKIFCLFVIVALVGGLYFLPPMVMNSGMSVSDELRPRDDFQIAADATSDAIGTGANNITNTRGAAGSNYVFAGGYELYYLVLNVSDADGFADILNVTAEFVTSASPGVSLGGFFCDTTTATVTVTELATGAANVRLAAGSTNISAGNDTDITIPFRFEWAIGSQTDVDINVTVMEAAFSEELQKNANIDIVGTLTLSDSALTPYTSYAQYDPFGTCQLTYHYTGYTTIYPLAAETDFYVTRAAVSSEGITERSWEANSYDQTSGIATWTHLEASGTAIGHTETYTLFAVSDGDGSSGTSLMATTYTETVEILSSPPPEQEERPDSVLEEIPLNTIIIVGGVIVVTGGALYMHQKSPKTRRRSPKRRKTTKRKKTTRRKKRK